MFYPPQKLPLHWGSDDLEAEPLGLSAETGLATLGVFEFLGCEHRLVIGNSILDEVVVAVAPRATTRYLYT
jgi:hypothetical protein